MPNMDSRTTYHCPERSKGGCVKKGGFCVTHHILCTTHNESHLLTELCVKCELDYEAAQNAGDDDENGEGQSKEEDKKNSKKRTKKYTLTSITSWGTSWVDLGVGPSFDG